MVVYLPPFRFLVVSPEYLLIIGFLGWSLIHFGAFKFGITTRSIFVFILTFALIVFYLILKEYLSTGIKDVGFQHLYWVKQFRFFVNILLVSLPFALFLYKRKWTVEELLEAFVVIGVVQSVFAVIMLAFPSFKIYVTEQMLDLQFMFENKGDRLLFRIFGLSSEYLFTYPIFQGFVLMIIFTTVAQGLYKYVWFVPLIIISIVFNARIGIVAIPIILFVYFVFTLRKSDAFVSLSKFIKIISAILLAVLLLVFSISFFIDPEIFNYMVLRGLESNSSGANHWDNLFERMLVLPSTIGGIFFGEGRYLYGNVYDVQSDIGYINDLLFGGVFYIIVYFTLIWYLFRNKYQSFSRIQKVLFSSVFLYIIVCNYKGPLLVNNGFLRAVFIVLFLHIINSKNESKSVSFDNYRNLQ
ncbi:hypothetical protein QWY93_02060 [Echinicola jeungdonensis]|uniref:Polysaccharide polymerase n=1 Tax=Echinicola jeungdonensis TaxID=709343 RepID=A0ABV5J487_9BACT|nr:hypothetical protein [Echinicola jeungdonensis]MDN3668118.1 hypothetical protein [Echinicola jeungdonensis]